MQHTEQENELKKVSLPVWGKLFKIILKDKRSFILMISIGIFVALLDALTVVIQQYALDNFIEKGDYTYFMHYTIINIIVAIGFGIGIWAFIYQSGKIEANVNIYYVKKHLKHYKDYRFPTMIKHHKVGLWQE